MKHHMTVISDRKMAFMWCVPPCRHHQLPVNQLTIQSISVASRESVCDLGLYMDSDMSMHKHVTQLVCLCYGVFRQFRSICCSLPRTALTTLVSSFTMSKVDYCNVVLAGLPQRELDHVQSVVNMAARLSADARKYDHITPLLRDLHWLRVPERVKFKLCVLMHHCLTGVAPRYLTELAVPVPGVPSTARRRLHSVLSADLVMPFTRRSTIGDRSFTVAGPRAWNSLPSDIRTSTSSFNTFKKHLKSYLFQLSFSSL